MERLEKRAEQDPRKELDPHTIAVVTSTLYPSWGREGAAEVDRVRGDLALQLAAKSEERGYQTVVVDGGSSPEFTERLAALGVSYETQSEKGMSAGRQQGFRMASRLEGVEMICWVEPEKVSLVEECIPVAAEPILDGLADIVVPGRDAESFATYPPYQAEYEQEANALWNAILREHGLLAEDAPDLDAWIGPRIFRNDPKILELFLGKYEFEKRVGRKLDEIVRPELWANALFLPLVAALAKGYRVAGVPVPYRHPAEQTAMEADSPEFKRKRDVQLKNIVMSTMHLVRLFEDDKKSRLRKVS